MATQDEAKIQFEAVCTLVASLPQDTQEEIVNRASRIKDIILELPSDGTGMLAMALVAAELAANTPDDDTPVITDNTTAPVHPSTIP